ncbi:MAG TPA: discoidin domain-containing protein, partial [Myxococcota bacterium]|nr:discoidin domain-containing protein [Myxococcota bacterium]
LEDPPTLACTTRQELALEFTDPQGRASWSQAAGALDLRVLEDAQGTLLARARFENTAWDRQVDTLELYSGAVPFAGTAGAPPSRGAACTLAGQSYPGGCPLTDGGMELSTSPDGLAQIDLGAVRAVELVVLRGSFSALELSASLDGQSWTPLASGLTGDSLQVTPPQPVQLRHLKLREGLDDYGQQRSLLLAEVSAW